MVRTSVNTKAMVVLSEENMLGKLQASESLLETIQKGLNDYLEKKRIFFPRYYHIYINVNLIYGLYKMEKYDGKK